MPDGLKTYPEYRASGLSWLERIPSHWELRRNGRLFSQRNETNLPDLPILEVSLKTGIRVRDLTSGERKQIMADRAKYKRTVPEITASAGSVTTPVSVADSNCAATGNAHRAI